MTEICDRLLKSGGPALLFEKPKNHTMPVLGNLFGTPQRVALAMGAESIAALRDIGVLLAALKEPEPPRRFGEVFDKIGMLKQAFWDMRPKELGSAPCQEIVWTGDDVDLGRLPIQTCWPGDAGPLITWGLTITRGPDKPSSPPGRLSLFRELLAGLDGRADGSQIEAGIHPGLEPWGIGGTLQQRRIHAGHLQAAQLLGVHKGQGHAAQAQCRQGVHPSVDFR